MKGVIDISYLRKEKWSRKILYITDTLLMSLLYLFLGLGVSTFINKRICKDLDKNMTKFEIFLETTGESLTVIIFLFLIIFFVERLPIIVPNPNPEHLFHFQVDLFS